MARFTLTFLHSFPNLIKIVNLYNTKVFNQAMIIISERSDHLNAFYMYMYMYKYKHFVGMQWLAQTVQINDTLHATSVWHHSRFAFHIPAKGNNSYILYKVYFYATIFCKRNFQRNKKNKNDIKLLYSIKKNWQDNIIAVFNDKKFVHRVSLELKI